MRCGAECQRCIVAALPRRCVVVVSVAVDALLRCLVAALMWSVTWLQRCILDALLRRCVVKIRLLRRAIVASRRCGVAGLIPNDASMRRCIVVGHPSKGLGCALQRNAYGTSHCCVVASLRCAGLLWRCNVVALPRCCVACAVGYVASLLRCVVALLQCVPQRCYVATLRRCGLSLNEIN